MMNTNTSNCDKVLNVRVQGRLYKLGCSNTETLLSVLERACAKIKPPIESSRYDLMHHNKPLDLALALHFSKVPNNATLEVEPAKNPRIESDVTILLQLRDGTRESGVFNPRTSLYDVLVQSAGARREYADNPDLVIVYMRREIFGENDLKNTTLRMLGLIGGRALLRIIHADVEKLNTQPNVSSVVQYKPKRDEKIENVERSVDANDRKEEIVREERVEIENAPRCSVSNENVSPVSDDRDENLANAAAEKNADVENDLTTKKSESCEIIYLGERKALAFSQKLASKFQFDDLPDDFYELTPNELRKLMRELEKKRMDLENKPLQLKTQENEKSIRDEHKEVIIRVYFPDQTILQGSFRATETISDVVKFVRVHLQDPAGDFYLYTSPPKKILEGNCSLVGNAVVYYGCEDLNQDSYLSPDIIEKLTSPRVANMSAYSNKETPRPVTAANDNNKKSASKDKIPKWFKPV